MSFAYRRSQLAEKNSSDSDDWRKELSSSNRPIARGKSSKVDSDDSEGKRQASEKRPANKGWISSRNTSRQSKQVDVSSSGSSSLGSSSDDDCSSNNPSTGKRRARVSNAQSRRKTFYQADTDEDTDSEENNFSRARPRNDKGRAADTWRKSKLEAPSDPSTSNSDDENSKHHSSLKRRKPIVENIRKRQDSSGEEESYVDGARAQARWKKAAKEHVGSDLNEGDSSSSSPSARRSKTQRRQSRQNHGKIRQASSSDDESDDSSQGRCEKGKYKSIKSRNDRHEKPRNSDSDCSSALISSQQSSKRKEICLDSDDPEFHQSQQSWSRQNRVDSPIGNRHGKADYSCSDGGPHNGGSNSQRYSRKQTNDEGHSQSRRKCTGGGQRRQSRRAKGAARPTRKSTRDAPYESPDSDDSSSSDDNSEAEPKGRAFGKTCLPAKGKDLRNNTTKLPEDECSLHSLSSRDKLRSAGLRAHRKRLMERAADDDENSEHSISSSDVSTDKKKRQKRKKSPWKSQHSDEPAHNMLNADAPRKVPPLEKKRAPLNPLDAAALERQNMAEMKQQAPQKTLGLDDLWDDDEENVSVCSTAKRCRPRRASTGKNTKSPSANLETRDEAGSDEDDDKATRRQVDRRRYKNGASRDSPAPEDDDKEYLYPTLARSFFGPFDCVPLELENKDKGTKGDHKVPAALARYLPKFQREGIQFLYTAVANGRGAILGDDMGLGKTLQVISLMSALLEKTGTRMDEQVLKNREDEAKRLQREYKQNQADALLGQRSFQGLERHREAFKEEMGLSKFHPILLLVPAVVIDNWESEASLFSRLSVKKYREGPLRDEALQAIKYGSAEILLCGHPLFGNNPEFTKIEEIPWKMIVVDEFHLFKSPTSKVSKNLRRLAKKHSCPIIGMTGTPMPNGFDELHNLVDLVQPGVLGVIKEFNKKIGQPIKNARAADASQEVKEKGEEKRLELNKILKPLYISRKKTDVLTQMPEKVEKLVLCELSDLQKKTYEHIRNLPDYLLVRGSGAPCDCGVNKRYFQKYSELGTTKDRIRFQKENKFVKRGKCCYKVPHEEDKENSVFWRNQHPNDAPCKQCPSCLLFPCLTKLYQLSSHLTLLQYDKSDKTGEKKDRDKDKSFAKIAFPADVLAKLPGGSFERCDELLQGRDHFACSGKMRKLHELLHMILKQSGRVLIFSYSVRTLDVIARYLDSEAHSYLRIDGSTPSKDRQGLVNQFQTEGRHFCFLLSTRAAGVGLNLTAANHVIIFDAEWNPAHDEQAQDRSFRIGQTKNVTVYRLVAAGTIDELKYLRQIYKLHLRQEAFRSAEGSEAAPRSFLGVEKDKDRKGELFGMENLMNFSKSDSFLSRVWKTEQSFVDGNSKDLVKALGNSGEAMQDETNALLHEKAAKKTFDHDDFLNNEGRVRPADREDRMGAETQVVNDFVVAHKSPSALGEPGSDGGDSVTSDDAGNEDEESTAISRGVHQQSLVARTSAAQVLSPASGMQIKTKKRPLQAESLASDEGESKKKSRKTGVVGDGPQVDTKPRLARVVSKPKVQESTTHVDILDARNNHQLQRAFKSTSGRSNFELCGMPSKNIRGKNTTFEKANLFKPSTTR